MIDGLTAKYVNVSGATDLQRLIEIELTITDPEQSTMDGQEAPEPADYTLSVVLVIGPADPNALSYLLPRRLFEQNIPIHVGALSLGPDDQLDLSEPMLEIIEVMAPVDRVVFLCRDMATLNAACLTIGLNPPGTD